MTRTKTKKTIEFVSSTRVKAEVDDFRLRRRIEIERDMTEKYRNIGLSQLSKVILSSVTSCLNQSLYFKCATFKDNPSYRQQLTMLYDFRQLLHGKRDPKYFTRPRNTGYVDYKDICTLLDELASYQKTGVVSDGFFRALLIEKENTPIEHIEEQLTYSREVTLVVIDEITMMVRDQIYRFFPSQGPKFVQEILEGNPYEGIAHVEVENEEEAVIVESRRVTFA